MSQREVDMRLWLDRLIVLILPGQCTFKDFVVGQIETAIPGDSSMSFDTKSRNWI